VQRDLEGGAKALLSLLPALAKKKDPHALEAAERLLLMLVSAHDMVRFHQRGTECYQTLLANPPAAHDGSEWKQLLALHDTGALLDPAAGDAEDDALEDMGEPNAGEAHEHDDNAIEAMQALGEVALLETVAAAEALLPQHKAQHLQAQTPSWSADVTASDAVDLTLPRRVGPLRGVAQVC
jgi:hypothetical protein